MKQVKLNKKKLDFYKALLLNKLNHVEESKRMFLDFIEMAENPSDDNKIGDENFIVVTNYVSALTNIAVIEHNEKNINLSLNYLYKALELSPMSTYLYSMIARSEVMRNNKLKAIEILEKAYALRSNDPYITDSIGWAYYLIDDYVEAEKYIKKAVELMPDDPTVNDHYGDILWKLNRNIQARYFWNYVLKLDDTDDDIRKQINIKIIEGLNNS